MQPDNDLLAERLWQHRGQQRRTFAVEPGKGQESVWDYPRPPVLVEDSRLVEVRIDECLIALAAWSYEHPTDEFKRIAGYFSFYPELLACYVGGERVRPQTGGFYGGWVTSEITGPFKGVPGTGDW